MGFCQPFYFLPMVISFKKYHYLESYIAIIPYGIINWIYKKDVIRQ